MDYKVIGMCANRVSPDVVSHLWKAMIQPNLLYATQSLPLSKSDIVEMDKLQAKLIKVLLVLQNTIEQHPC